MTIKIKSRTCSQADISAVLRGAAAQAAEAGVLPGDEQAQAANALLTALRADPGLVHKVRCLLCGDLHEKKPYCAGAGCTRAADGAAGRPRRHPHGQLHFETIF